MENQCSWFWYWSISRFEDDGELIDPPATVNVDVDIEGEGELGFGDSEDCSLGFELSLGASVRVVLIWRDCLDGALAM